MLVHRWEMTEGMTLSGCPTLPTWCRDLGTDPTGVRWLCEVEYMPHFNPPCFQVLFDTDDARHDDPFCRTSVLDAPNYWNAVREKYSAKYVKYEDIGTVVDEFIKSRSIDPTA